MITFSMDSTPPTEAEIQAEKQRIEKRLRILKFAQSMLVVPAVIAITVIFFAKPGPVVMAIMNGIAISCIIISIDALIQAVIVSGLAGGVVGAVILITHNDTIDSNPLAIGGICGIVVGLILAEIKWGKYEYELDRLMDVPMDKCEEAIDCCMKSSKCEQYRQAVVAQGRYLTLGEYKAMVEEAGKEKIKESYILQCKRLHSPEKILE